MVLVSKLDLNLKRLVKTLAQNIYIKKQIVGAIDVYNEKHVCHFTGGI